jgi:transposase-like protein
MGVGMGADMEDLKSLTAAIRFFSDPMNCVDTVAAMRWPDGKPVCPMCACAEFYWLAKQMRWKCKSGKCGKQYSVKVGTIFEESALALDKWLVAVWLIANCKNGISSYEIARSVGVTQKSAWFMLHRIRKALANSSWIKLGGPEGAPVEVDETFIGGDLRKMHRKRRLAFGQQRGPHGKAVVMGMLDREARQVRAKVIPNVKRETLQNEILNQIEKKSAVYTDGGGSDTITLRRRILYMRP